MPSTLTINKRLALILAFITFVLVFASISTRSSQASGELLQYVANQLTLSGDAIFGDNRYYNAGFMSLFKPTTQSAATGNIQIPSGYSNILLHIEVYIGADIHPTTVYSPYFHWEYTIDAAGSTAADSTTISQAAPGDHIRFYTFPVTAGSSVPVSINVTGNSDPSQTGQFDASRANIFVYLTGDLNSCSPTPGTITTDVTAGIPGTTVNLTGTGWQTGTGNIYQVAIDGINVLDATQIPASCSDQPNIRFDIPCPTPPGTHYITCRLINSSTQQVIVENTPPVPLTVTQPTISPLASPCPLVQVTFQYADGRSINGPLRLGISSKDVTRTEHLLAIVQPSGFASLVMLDSTNKLKLSHVKESGGIIYFDVDGVTASTVPEDSSIIAENKSTGQPISVLSVSVLVPKKIAVPHDTVGVPITPVNLAANKDSNPPAPLPQGQAYLVTVYATNLTIRVTDQFDQPIGYLYAESKITEQPVGGKPVDTNIKLDVTSFYLDPVGTGLPKYGFSPAGIRASIVPAKSKEAMDWPNAQPQPLPPGIYNVDPASQTFTVAVDGFPLIPLVQRDVTITTPPLVYTIIWP